MKYLRSFFSRITGMFADRAADADMRAEMASHAEMETAENIRRGMRPDEARRQAMISSGGLSRAAEAVREQRGIPLVESVAADIKFALRALRRSPAFTIVVVATLALAIGANTAIFSVVNGVLLKPLPHRDGDRLLYLRHSVDGPGGTNISFSVPEVRDYRTGAPALGGIAEYDPFSFALESEGSAERISVALVTGNFFEVMGLSPVLGRTTTPADDGPGVQPVMVLAYEFWIKRFGGDSSIIGKRLRLEGNPVTVIGVLQPAPWFPSRVDVMLNMVVSAHHLGATMTQNRNHRMTEVIARLAPGATIAEAKAQVAAVTSRIQDEHKDSYDPNAHYRVAVVPFKEALGDKARLTLWLLMGSAAFVLIIAAANVANLTMMRGVRREHELVVRSALGASAARLRRLVLVENLVLTFLGAALGVLVALGSMGLLVSLAARYSPRSNEIGLDAAVFAFTLALSFAVALLLSFVALLPKEGMLASIISAGARRISGGMRKQRLQRGLVVTQIAISVMLLAGAGLLTRSMLQLSSVKTGLLTEDVLTMSVSVVTTAEMISGNDAAGKEKYLQMRREIGAIPGVLDVALGSTVPLSVGMMRAEVSAEGKSFAVGEAVPSADMRTADPAYFRAAGIPLIKGRPFAETDVKGGAPVVIVNQTFADKFFPGEDPIGKRIAWIGALITMSPFSSDWRTIVGVAGNTQDGGLEAKSKPVVFMPWAQELAIGGGLVIRAENASGVAGAATRIVRRIAPTSPIEHVLTVAQIKDQGIAPSRLNAALISSFGMLALVIAAVGIAGVLAFSVSARTNEIGIRMSLGADRGQVQRMILREGGVLVALGLSLGIGGAYFASTTIRGLLFGVPPHDPVTLIGVAVVMATTGIVACWIPARRAARIDPMIAIRSN